MKPLPQTAALNMPGIPASPRQPIPHFTNPVSPNLNPPKPPKQKRNSRHKIRLKKSSFISGRPKKKEEHLEVQ